MANYKVTVVEEVMHVVTVEAHTEDDAREIAIAEVIEDTDKYFTGVDSRYVKMVLKGA